MSCPYCTPPKGVHVSLDENMLFAGKKRVRLSAMQTEIAYILRRAAPRVVLWPTLAAGVYGLAESSIPSIKVTCSALRKKLAGTGIKIESVRQRGMRMICN